MRPAPARWIDLGLIAPRLFHATYSALAEYHEQEGSPVVVWARCHEHVCLGQHQSASAELIPEIAVPVVQRPLGGGTVWVDPDQYCFVIIAPLGHLRLRPAEWFAWALDPAVKTYRHFGLPVALRENDLWLHGRKIGGSGAATIGNYAVIGASFMLHFPAERFSRCIACPSHEFRAWLTVALRNTITDWMSHQRAPGPDELVREFRSRCSAAFGWEFRESELTEAERRARDEAETIADGHWCDGAGKLVPHGIKLKAGTFLTEKHADADWVRVLTRDGRIARIALSEPVPPSCLEQLTCDDPNEDGLARCLAACMPGAKAARWAQLILETARFS